MRKISKKDSKKQGRPNIRLLLISIVFILVLLYSEFPLYSPFIMSSFSNILLKNQLRSTALDITKDANNDTEAVKAIMEWQAKHMTNTYKKCGFGSNGNLCINLSLQLFCVRMIGHDSPSWVLFSMCGACEEYAMLFSELANSINITTRSIHSHGEDHNLAEVLINGEWVVVDPSMNWYDKDPRYYDTNWGNRSYVYALYKNNSIEDVTSRYTDTGTLIVLAYDNGKPLQNVTIVVGSESVGKNINIDKDCKTDENGICRYELGGNNYTITAIAGGFLKFSDTNETTLIEKEESKVYVNPNKFEWQNNYIQISILIAALFCILIIYEISKKVGLLKRIIFEMKFQIYRYVLDLRFREILYFLAFLNSVILKGNDPLAVALFIPIFMLGVESLITIIINPEFTKKQYNSVKNIFTLLALFFSIPVISWALNYYTFALPLSITFVLFGFLFRITNFKKRAGHIIFSGLLMVSLISMLLSNGEVNDLMLLNALAFSTLSVVLIRITDCYPNMRFTVVKEIEDYKKLHEKLMDDALRLKPTIFIQNSYPIVLDDKIFFVNSRIIDDNGKSVSNQKIIKEASIVTEYKKKIEALKKSKRKNKFELLYAHLKVIIFNLYINKTICIQASRWLYDNYEKLQYLFKTKEDKELHKNDIQMNIEYETLEQRIYTIKVLLKMYSSMPSLKLYNLIQQNTNKTIKHIEALDKNILQKRLILAGKDYKKKNPKATESDVEMFLEKQRYSRLPKDLIDIKNEIEKLL